MPTKTLCMLRHGETMFNLAGRTQGWCDSPLSDRGVVQSRRAGEAFAARGLTFDHAYSSTAERCCDTLEVATAAAYGAPMPYTRMKDLREISFGTSEGTHNYADIREMVLEPGFAGVEGGETGSRALARFAGCLDSIMARPGNQCVLVVTSGGIAMQFYLAHRATSAVEQTLFANCLAYVYDWDDGSYRCREIFVPRLDDLEAPGLPAQVKRLATPL